MPRRKKSEAKKKRLPDSLFEGVASSPYRTIFLTGFYFADEGVDMSSWRFRHPQNWEPTEVLNWVYHVAEVNNMDVTQLRGEVSSASYCAAFTARHAASLHKSMDVASLDNSIDVASLCSSIGIVILGIVILNKATKHGVPAQVNGHCVSEQLNGHYVPVRVSGVFESALCNARRLGCESDLSRRIVPAHHSVCVVGIPHPR